MALLSPNKTYPSLVISQDKIQLLHLGNKGKKILAIAEEKLEKGTIRAGEVQNSDSLAKSIQKLLLSANLTTRLIVAGLPENKSYTKIIKLPKLKSEELAEAVTWEAETYLPISLDQVYMDWKIINEGKTEVTVLIIAVPKPIADGFTEAIRKAGAIPLAYETSALSLVRLIEDKNERALIIRIGINQAILTLTKGKAIEASAVVGLEDSTEGFAHLLETVNKMLSFYEEKNKNEGITKAIYVCGEGATEEVLNKIAKTSGREVKLCPIPIKNLPHDKGQHFALAASLALKVIKDPQDEYTINLLPNTIQQEFDTFKKQKINKHLLTLSTVVLTLTTIASSVALVYLLSLRASLEEEKQALSPLPQETGAAIKKTQNVNKTTRTITQAGANRTFPQMRLAAIVPIIPQGINITSLSLDEAQKKLVMTGKAQTRQSLLDLRDNLEKTEDFSEAILPLSSLQRAENIDFVLTTTID